MRLQQYKNGTGIKVDIKRDRHKSTHKQNAYRSHLSVQKYACPFTLSVAISLVSAVFG
jgi:hypothetical protein